MGEYEDGTWYLDMAVEGALWMREYVPDERIAWFANHDEADLDEYQLVIQAGHIGEIILKYKVWDRGISKECSVKRTSMQTDEKDKRYLVRFLTNIWMDPFVTHGYDFLDFRDLIEGSPMKFKCVAIDSINGKIIMKKCSEIIPSQYSVLAGYIGYSCNEIDKFDEVNGISFLDYESKLMECIEGNNNGFYGILGCTEPDPSLSGEIFEFGIWYR